MAYWLVKARPKEERLAELRRELEAGGYVELRPFGRTVTESLRGARRGEDGLAVWEEEDYCVPPLKEERAAVLDRFFDEIEVEAVGEGEGWQRIEKLPRIFPGLRQRGCLILECLLARLKPCPDREADSSLRSE